ncbi:hypothetical protein YC2023_107234 [Brassica napus]
MKKASAARLQSRVQSQQNIFTGLVAYLAEKLLVAQFIDMKISGNISANLKSCKGIGTDLTREDMKNCYHHLQRIQDSVTIISNRLIMPSKLENIIEQQNEGKYKRLRKVCGINRDPPIKRKILNFAASVEILSVVIFVEEEMGRDESFTVDSHPLHCLSFALLRRPVNDCLVRTLDLTSPLTVVSVLEQRRSRREGPGGRSGMHVQWWFFFREVEAFVDPPPPALVPGKGVFIRFAFAGSSFGERRLAQLRAAT